MRFIAFCVLTAFALLATSPAAALSSCKVGDRVKAPGGKVGTVTATAGSGCTVKADGEAFTNVYGAFMLDPAPGAAAPAKAAASATKPAASGLYQCTSSTSGILKLRILPGNRYANEQGVTGRYTVSASGQMAFQGGPWDGFFGAPLAGGRIGLSSKRDSSFYAMTCDPRG